MIRTPGLVETVEITADSNFGEQHLLKFYSRA